MTVTNMTSLDNITGFVDVVRYANTLSNGLFFLMAMLSFSFILFFGMFSRTRSFSQSISATLYISLIVSLMMWWAGLLIYIFPITNAVLVVLNIAALIIWKDW